MSRTKKEEKEKQREKAIAMWQSCQTQEEIAEAVGLTRQAISTWDEDFAKNLQEKDFAKSSDFTPPYYNVWKTKEKSNKVDHFGNSEPQWLENREFVRQKETAIKARTAQTIIENGRDLMEVKERLDHGQFMEWCKVNFPWSHSAINKMINVADKFVNFTNLDMAKSALYLLAQDSTPEEARTEVIKRAEAGEKITQMATGRDTR